MMARRKLCVNFCKILLTSHREFNIAHFQNCSLTHRHIDTSTDRHIGTRAKFYAVLQVSSVYR